MRSGRKVGLLLGRPQIFDVTLVVLLFLPSLIVLPFTLLDDDPDTAMRAGLFLLAVPPLLARRRHPVPVAVVIAALDIAGRLTITPPGDGRLRRHVLRVPHGGPPVLRRVRLRCSLFPLVLTGAGLLARSRAETRPLKESIRTEEAVQAERRRIARELHDVVAHHITVVSALVGGARVTLPTEPPEATQALLAAEQNARQALTEMRHLLKVLRADGSGGDDGPVTVPPSPGGFGLVGMAERVALCGRSLDAGPGPAGGFRVHARLPL
ncbi:sensor histidine kinase [Streptosporangium sp. NPDC049376]|uniref:sensor histidine kinase n=1 Tax=Streptosporangium sp. NPDC049376 TaxID=3366192 RepID=UPI0037B6B045